MSSRVVWGLAPAGKPHPATKWSLLMALLVVVVLGVPTIAAAGQPAVQAPTGAQSGGVFTGIYSFSTYISCASGLSFNSSYSNNLEGTHSFTFLGAADGSLLVSIDGGGMMLITSCGDPFTPPHTTVASYSVTKNSSPPTPTPTPTPSATPAPTSAPAGPSNSGGGAPSSGSPSGGGAHAVSTNPATPGHSSAVAGTLVPAAAPGAPAPVPPSSAVAAPAPRTAAKKATITSTIAAAATPRLRHLSLGWVAVGFGLLGLGLLAMWMWRSPAMHGRIHSSLMPARLKLEPYWFRLRHALQARLRGHAHDQPKPRGLSAHHHTGKLLAHHHTSYPALVFLILLSTVLAAGVSLTSRADSSLVSLTVSGPPPTTPATIDQPPAGQHFSDNTQTIRGTCPSGLGIEVYRNGAFAGSTLCDVNGLYAVLVTLVPDQNDLVARDLDALSQYGPDSNSVSLFYDAPPPPPPTGPVTSPSPSSTPEFTPSPSPSSSPVGGQALPQTPKQSKTPAAPKPTPTPALLLDSTRHFYQGVGINAPVEWTITIAGGHGPYDIIWEWGDGLSDTTNTPAPGDIQLGHAYAKPGTYQVTVRITDARQQQSVIQLVTIVSGPTTVAGFSESAAGKPGSLPGSLVVVWPLLGVTGVVVVSFWLGESHKLALLRPTGA